MWKEIPVILTQTRKTKGNEILNKDKRFIEKQTKSTRCTPAWDTLENYRKNNKQPKIKLY